MARKIPVFLLLLPVFFVLHHYNEVFGFMKVNEVLRFLFITIGLTGLCFLVLYLFTRSLPQTAIAAFLLLGFVLYFGALHNTIRSIARRSVLSHYITIAFTGFLIIGGLVYYFKKYPAALEKFNRYLTVLLILLTAVEVYYFGANYYRYSKDRNLIYPAQPICSQPVSCHQAESSKPDIYFLLFDGYTNDATLLQQWNYDNSYMTGWLSRQGFHVLPNSRSNYNATVFSISAAFNMNYIDKDKGHIGSVTNTLKANASLSDNETFCLLQKEQYTIRFLAPFDNPIEQHGLDNLFDYLYKDRLYDATLPGRIQYAMGRRSAQNPSRAPLPKKLTDIQKTIELIKQTTDSSPLRKPQFVYGHFMITHEPYLFDSIGQVATAKMNDPMKAYLWQVAYANKVIKELVGHILAHNKKNTVIIIQGDHGYKSFHPAQPDLEFAILNAIYFPDGNYTQLYDKMSPVNSFRVLFNHYFCRNLKLINDSSTAVIDHWPR